MADNGTAASGPTIAWDDIGGVAYQRVKLTFGADGSATDVNTGSGLPVSGTITANAGTGTFAISAAALPLPSGAATETTLAAISTKTPALGQATMANSSPVVIASNQSSLPVTVGNASIAVTGTFWQATQPVSIAATVAVSGPLTDTQLRATAVPVSLASTTITGTVAATQSGTWNINSITTLPSIPAGNNNIGDVDVATLPVAFDSGAVNSTTQRVVIAADAEQGTTQGLTSLRDALVAQRYTVLSDSIADGIDTKWTSTVTNGGTTTSTGGEGLIQTSANAAGSAQLVSTTVPYFPGQVSWFNSAVRFGDTGSAGNVRRIGVFTVSGTTPQEGFYYELNGTTLNAVVVKAGTPTAVASASWSRFTQAPFTLDTNYHSLEIRWTANSVLFFIDNVLRHSVSGTTAPITSTLNFPMAVQSINSSGATNRLIAVRNCGIGRFGNPEAGKDATDVGRVIRHFFMDNYVAAPVVEALMSVTQSYNNAAVAGTTTPAVVPQGKMLRLTGGRISTKSLATAGSVVLRVRANVSGTVVIGSPIVHTFEIGSVAAVAGLLSEQVISFPEGIDLSPGTGVGFSLAGYNATGTLTLQGVTRFEVWGYEYTI